MADLLDRISKDLTLPKSQLEDAIRLSWHRYKKIHVKKRSGGVRTMIQPAAELKPILYWLDIKLFSSLPVSSIATAFVNGSSILNNALVHRDMAYSARVDMSNFFSSIRIRDLLIAIKNQIHSIPEWVKSTDSLEIIRRACFDKDDRLPIGYPTSPRIANAVMYDIDTKLMSNLNDKIRFGVCNLTRYADDFVFSSNTRGACNEFLIEIRKVLREVDSPRLTVNEEKTRFMSRERGSTLITGLRVKPNKEIGIHPNYRDHIRLLMKLYKELRIQEDDIKKLKGHLAFVEHVDPQFFTRLSFKYCDEIAELRRREKSIG